MNNQNKEIINTADDYKYDFKDEDVTIFNTGKGLSEEVIRQISAAKNEPDWMLELRLKAYQKFVELPLPKWGPDLSEIDFNDLANILNTTYEISNKLKEKILINTKYDGYIQKAFKQASKMEVLETRKIPADLDYNLIPNIASEAKDKLSKVKPLTVSQASRISGVNPSDISILLVYLENYKHE